jgi:mono/diheme cytochrome c family protein
MNRWLLPGVLAASALAAFVGCSTSPDSLQGNQQGYNPDGTPAATNPDGTPATTPAPDGEVTPNSSIPTPAEGAGSDGAAGYKEYVAKVFPVLTAACGSCHINGAGGATKYMTAEARGTYQAISALGYIVADSRLLRKGAHVGPAWSATQAQTVAAWLATEANDRKGQAAPVNVLAKIGACASLDKFKALNLQGLRTTRRQNENADQCTGCDNSPCATCHGAGEYDFASNPSAETTFNFNAEDPQKIRMYFGVNGAEPVASNALKTKSDATKTAAPYSHPLYALNPDFQAKLDDFVNDAITKYKAQKGECTPTP